MWLLSWGFLWLLATWDLAIDMWYIILHRNSYTNCSKLWKTTGIISICLANIWCAWSDRTGCVDAIIKNPYEINQHPLTWQWKGTYNSYTHGDQYISKTAINMLLQMNSQLISGESCFHMDECTVDITTPTEKYVALTTGSEIVVLSLLKKSDPRLSEYSGNRTLKANYFVVTFASHTQMKPLRTSK